MARLPFIVLALALAACRLVDRHGRDDDAAGSYARACASCHGIDGRGDGPVAGALRVRPADLTTLRARHGGVFPRDFVIAVITGERELPGHGTREMPVWSDRFGPASGATTAAAIHARRHVELLADHVESLQRPR